MILKVYQDDKNAEPPIQFKLAEDAGDVNILARRGSGVWHLIAWFDSHGVFNTSPLSGRQIDELGLPSGDNACIKIEN